MRNEVYIRVDADNSTGLGHFYRCLALAEFIEAHFIITFVYKNFNLSLKRKIKKFNFQKIEKENDFFKKVIENSVVVVDGYDFGRDFFQELKKTKCKIISIQDIEQFSENVDLVINHLPLRENKYKDVELLAGPEYAIIRKKILKKPINQKKGDGFLISLGGTENYFIINQLVDLIKQLDKYATIRILTTQANGKNIIGEGHEIFINQDEESVIELIDNSEFCLITSGMISYEVLARNKKAIVGALNEGQASIGKTFCEMALVEYIGFWKNIKYEKFKEAIKGNSIRPNVVKNIFDGKSDERILKKILQL